jgi:hypothetical protein
MSLNAEAKQQILVPMLVELACLSEIAYYIQFCLRLLGYSSLEPADDLSKVGKRARSFSKIVMFTTRPVSLFGTRIVA